MHNKKLMVTILMLLPLYSTDNQLALAAAAQKGSAWHDSSWSYKTEMFVAGACGLGGLKIVYDNRAKKDMYLPMAGGLVVGGVAGIVLADGFKLPKFSVTIAGATIGLLLSQAIKKVDEEDNEEEIIQDDYEDCYIGNDDQSNLSLVATNSKSAERKAYMEQRLHELRLENYDDDNDTYFSNETSSPSVQNEKKYLVNQEVDDRLNAFCVMCNNYVLNDNEEEKQRLANNARQILSQLREQLSNDLYDHLDTLHGSMSDKQLNRVTFMAHVNVISRCLDADEPRVKAASMHDNYIENKQQLGLFNKDAVFYQGLLKALGMPSTSSLLVDEHDCYLGQCNQYSEDVGYTHGHDKYPHSDYRSASDSDDVLFPFNETSSLFVQKEKKYVVNQDVDAQLREFCSACYDCLLNHKEYKGAFADRAETLLDRSKSKLPPFLYANLHGLCTLVSVEKFDEVLFLVRIDDIQQCLDGNSSAVAKKYEKHLIDKKSGCSLLSDEDAEFYKALLDHLKMLPVEGAGLQSFADDEDNSCL